MAIQYLSSAEKEAILREKYLATMKPVSANFVMHSYNAHTHTHTHTHIMCTHEHVHTHAVTYLHIHTHKHVCLAALGIGTPCCSDLSTPRNSQWAKLPGSVQWNHQQCPAETEESCHLCQPTQCLGTLQRGNWWCLLYQEGGHQGFNSTLHSLEHILLLLTFQLYQTHYKKPYW